MGQNTLLKGEIEISAQDYKNGQGVGKFNKYEKRKRVAQDNREASKLILASKARRAKEDAEQIYAGNDAVKDMKENNSVPIEYKIKSVNMQIEAIDKRIKTIDNEERKNNGFLKESTRNRRKDYRIVLDELLTEKSIYVKEADKPKKKPKQDEVLQGDVLEVNTIQPEGVKEDGSSNTRRIK